MSSRAWKFESSPGHQINYPAYPDFLLNRFICLIKLQYQATNMFDSTERWMSGLSRTPGKRVYVNSVSRVRIPSSLPDSKKPVLIKTGFFLAFNSGGKLLQSLFRKEITFILNLLYISAPSIQISFAGVSFTPLYTFIKNPSLKRSSEYAGLIQIQGYCHD